VLCCSVCHCALRCVVLPALCCVVLPSFCVVLCCVLCFVCMLCGGVVLPDVGWRGRVLCVFPLLCLCVRVCLRSCLCVYYFPYFLFPLIYRVWLVLACVLSCLFICHLTTITTTTTRLHATQYRCPQTCWTNVRWRTKGTQSSSYLDSHAQRVVFSLILSCFSLLSCRCALCAVVVRCVPCAACCVMREDLASVS
jgi:hypothetical protein